MVGGSRVEFGRGVAFAALLTLAGCSSEPLAPAGGAGEGDVLGGKLLSVPVPSSGEVLVELATPALLPVAGDARPLQGWDLGFRGFQVFTNGGVSNPGAGAAFGLLSLPTFLSDTTPVVPFLTPDQAGGAFRRWFAYDVDNHVILSRFHVYGVRDGERVFKVQLLSYYAGRSSETSASYTLRYAELGASGPGPTLTLKGLDASAEGDAKNPQVPSICVDFSNGEVLSLTPAEARESLAWHLCLRRDAISVNGGQGGPRGATALDLDAALTDGELVADLRARSAEGELTRFEAIGPSEFAAASADFRADSLVTAFTDRWLQRGSEPPAPERGVWLVVGGDGAAHHLVIFEGFEGASAAGPGTVRLRVKAVN